MKGLIRGIIGHSAMFPFAVSYRMLSKLVNADFANRYIGENLTKLSAVFVGSGIPVMRSNADFAGFKRRIKRNFAMCSVLYDIETAKEDNCSIEFRILNCPFTSALKNFGVSELCKFVCAGDFLVAGKNRDKWKFRRSHSHGTDGRCCDHTYISIK